LDQVFRNLRDQFKTDGGEYMRSLCGDISLRELPTPGKSGAAFFVSNDDKYLIKTMTKGEVQLFKKIIQKYYEHMMTYKNSLLVKLYGMYWVECKNEKLFMVVMGNLLASEAPIHRRYDLKVNRSNHVIHASAHFGPWSVSHFHGYPLCSSRTLKVKDRM
jgi:1-phosphatidylinositol-4-phosphate 5-kinase